MLQRKDGTDSVGAFHLERTFKFQFTAFEGSFLGKNQTKALKTPWGLFKGFYSCKLLTVHSELYSFVLLYIPDKRTVKFYISLKLM